MKVYIGPYRKHRFWHNWFDYTPKKIAYVKIDREDTWSMDNTLASIILPMLKQLKETTHGFPSDLTEKEWDKILDQMIYSFEQKCKDDWMEPYYGYPDWKFQKIVVDEQKKISKGFELFGKYYENLWD